MSASQRQSSKDHQGGDRQVSWLRRLARWGRDYRWLMIGAMWVGALALGY